MKYKNKLGYTLVELAMGIMIMGLLLITVMSFVSNAIKSEQCGINDVLKESCKNKIVFNGIKNKQ